MVVIALGFAAGALLLQQQPSLPSLLQMVMMGVGTVICITMLHYLAQRLTTSSFHHKIWLGAIIHPFIILVIAFMLGFTWAYTLASYRLSDALPSVWEQKNITLVGVVASLPEATERGQRFVFEVEQVLTPEAQVPKRISLNINQAYPAQSVVSSIPIPEVHVGERWQWTVRLKRPHGTVNPHGFDFEGWALAEHIRAMGVVRLKSDMQRLSARVQNPRYWVDYARANIALRIDTMLQHKPYLGVIRALVIGEDSQISQSDWDVYLRTGTNHLMSISGLHITMLSGLIFTLVYNIWRRSSALLMHLPAKKAAAISGMLTAIIYAALAGFSIPTQRTLYMLMTVTIMLLFNRPVAMSRMLAVALFVVVLIDPWAVNAAGFWLSFGAVATIAFATAGRIGQIHWFKAAVTAQWAVTIGLLPFLVAMFGQFSLISPVANAIAIPIISFFVVPLAILGSLLPIDFALFLSHSILDVTMTGLHWLSDLSFATWQQSAPSIWTLLLALLGVLWLLMPNGLPLRWLGGVFILPMFIGQVDIMMPGEARVTVLDVGQGLSVVVQTAHHSLLYDAGARFNAQADAGGRTVVPFLRAQGVRQLSGMVLSHDDLDHSGGIASVANHVPTAWFLSSLQPDALLLQQAPFDTWPSKQHIRCVAGQHWVWDKVQFQVLYPSQDRLLDANIKDNDKSCVIKMTTQYGNLLLTGDIERSSELYLLEHQSDMLASDILVAPHHGSKTSSSLGFIDAVNPTYVVMTNGYLNRFGHPKPLVQQRYVDTGAQVYRSDYDGAVQLTFQANQPLMPTAWRKAHPKYWHDRYP
jgi:competence protein ComEC